MAESTHHNQPTVSVSEISGALKRTVEEAFGYVRVRGELSGTKQAASGHLYYSLKDDKAVLSGVCWKGLASKLSFTPEDGLEVIATGKLSTYPGRSNYQLIAEWIEPAGAGALMALLEKRKAQLKAEGLFDPARKRALPFMPRRIAVITSPTGAVIQDILHRVQDRFPVHVQLFPVTVQGDNAAAEMLNALQSITRLQEKPDLVIIARGGGSIEDLWPFNDEALVRAVAAFPLPIISAVGHETDTTLIDYVSDQRAPTPTAAAEMALPVRAEWQHAVQHLATQLSQRLHSLLVRKQELLQHLYARRKRPLDIVHAMAQQLDDRSERLQLAITQQLQQQQSRTAAIAARLLSPVHVLARRELAWQAAGDALQQWVRTYLPPKHTALMHLSSRFSYAIERQVNSATQRILPIIPRLQQSMHSMLEQRHTQMQHQAQMLEVLSYKNTLARGFAVVRDAGKSPIISAAQAANNAPSFIEFADGVTALTSNNTTPALAPPRRKKPTKKAPTDNSQGDLF